ncbi:hypothetical protein [Persicitalea jodogahamensis]|uniref:Uncharacterized protein n=1 Tax=Persicitalea jodogahamensis TaxID=402147 RepID=A0A8J3D4U7_9BACT|nr:hypothetical protein [Persicitalea jodogahamensis]GHB59974.1 hypothetical protein GCM10007390_12120 [Persicitalea jodogahamensis]
MNPYKFTGEEGKFVTATDASKLTERFQSTQREDKKKPGTFTEAQFFGNKQLQKLMQKDGCVGLRFYFAKTDAKEISEQLVVVAVDADGRDITSSRIGLKDMPAGEDDALTDGPCCPHHCTP